jgi:hypothetical protein
MNPASEDLYDDFTGWADKILLGPVPDAVVAFCFCLTENDEAFYVHVIGSDVFDPENDEWASQPTFVANDNPLEMSQRLASGRWEVALYLVLGWVARYFHEGTGGAVTLRARRAVAVSFVDGDLHFIWPRAAA